MHALQEAEETTYTTGAPSGLALVGGANVEATNTTLGQVAYVLKATAGLQSIGAWTTAPDDAGAEWHTNTIALKAAVETDRKLPRGLHRGLRRGLIT